MPDLYEFGELYHDYSIFGFKNYQAPGIFKPNQKCKAPIISAYISMAIAKSKESGKVSFAELFCADAYYAMLAIHFGADSAIGIDNNSVKHSNYVMAIAKKIGIKGFDFLLDDVHNIDKLEGVDIVANIGGLYHVSDPKQVLLKSYNMAKKYLIVQSVVSLANDDPNYFETPAPGWSWGSRFNRSSFDKMIKRFKWSVVDSHFNELTGNRKLHSRGSVYYLIQK